MNGAEYSFYKNINIPIYIFISIIFFIFIGLSSSIEDIYSERRMILREKFLNLKMSLFVSSKFLTLSIFAMIQVILYYLISSKILGFQGNFIHSFIFLSGAAFVGQTGGLLISSFINNSKALINILPLVLIPQIIFGGAIIQFEKMNEQIKFDKHKPIPEIVEFIPSRWLFEGLFVSFAKNNQYDKKINQLEKERLTIKEKYQNGLISYDVFRKLVFDNKSQKSDASKSGNVKLFRNEYIFLTTNLMDGHFLNHNKNVFLSSYKKFLNFRFTTFQFNLGIILLYIIVFQVGTFVILKFIYKE